eukprot:CAMPEP_0174745584 /NCGR_PEP_ID=MMETSP1094-20130205/87112_1 /TAXON_ID=156173 /ORGANISM="Chrysochromulina brevifilum, Strain UTEX LB 985" /LENGTH=68 /DNA_ID=CAMNT_0015950157 /DNA_START=327 /DNA_END=533 /DNA_ORIENTATION=+
MKNAPPFALAPPLASGPPLPTWTRVPLLQLGLRKASLSLHAWKIPLAASTTSKGTLTSHTLGAQSTSL